MKVKKPNALIYFIAYILAYPLLKLFFRLEIDRSELEMPKGAYIVLANHYTMIDFLFAMLPLYPQRLNTVVSRKYFNIRFLNKILPMGGCIPKNMFDPDLQSIIGIKTVLKRGDGLLLFPEGRCSSSNTYMGMHKSTGKMIKKFDVPILSCYIEGGENCISHWRKGVRFGRVRVTFKNLFSTDDTKTLSVDQINNAIDARLSGIEGVPLPSKKPLQTFHARRLAEGLHLVLFYCPKCNTEFTMSSKGNSIFCISCGNSATIGRDSKLTATPGSVTEPEISLWYRDQARHVMQSLSEDMKPIVEKVKVRTPSPKPGGGMVESGVGTMKTDPKGWHFDGTISGQQVNLFFPVEAVPAMSYGHNDNYQIYCGGEHYMFTPEDPRKCIKYVVLAECLHWKFSSNVLLTPGINSGFAPPG
ncbi:MAG: 1-acyl-sn-glycerol-3-phosphate acyltransferase [Oscillospiraceae bacterium]|nr:1-acyl-sn-glycerol-3-phosphate acyltransferase [Oscillospiraceae bacterium]